GLRPRHRTPAGYGPRPHPRLPGIPGEGRPPRRRPAGARTPRDRLRRSGRTGRAGGAGTGGPTATGRHRTGRRVRPRGPPPDRPHRRLAVRLRRALLRSGRRRARLGPDPLVRRRIDGRRRRAEDSDRATGKRVRVRREPGHPGTRGIDRDARHPDPAQPSPAGGRDRGTGAGGERPGRARGRRRGAARRLQPGDRRRPLHPGGQLRRRRPARPRRRRTRAALVPAAGGERRAMVGRGKARRGRVGVGRPVHRRGRRGRQRRGADHRRSDLRRGCRRLRRGRPRRGRRLLRAAPGAVPSPAGRDRRRRPRGGDRLGNRAPTLRRNLGPSERRRGVRLGAGGRVEL
ncbi:MAG: hypothetical protein AVDCRST_MAG73-3419, partial [uncultured Thermomicrobiales bacterium]